MEAGLLKDSDHRAGLPLRNLLRSGAIAGQRQEKNRRWFIDAQHEDPDASVGWDLNPGERILRSELHAQYGENTDAGISPSTESPNVFVFSDPGRGHPYGYHDHWDGERFHYYGMGRQGDQEMTGYNKALRDHRAAGRAVRVFQGTGGEVTYLDEFEVDPGEPDYRARATDLGGETREVIVFRLRRVDPAIPITKVQEQAGRPQYRDAPEDRRSAPPKTRVSDPDAIGRATNAHSRLQNLLERHVREQEAETFSPGTPDPEFDLAWTKDGTFYVAEVKSLTARNEVTQLRLGLGQILHYRHLMSAAHPKMKCILFVEREPTYDEWTNLCDQLGVDLLWPEHLSMGNELVPK